MRALFISFILISTCLSVFSQDQNKISKKVYKADNGALYIQKTLPVYLWLSTSPDSLSDKVRLTSESMPEYTNPMYFDTDGFNSIHIKGQVDNKTKQLVSADGEVVYEIYGDSQPPDSYTIVQSKHVKYQDGKRVYNSECVLDILAYDMFSGVGKIFYSINENKFQEYIGQLTITIDGNINLKYYAVDNVGNTEGIKELSFIIEK